MSLTTPVPFFEEKQTWLFAFFLSLSADAIIIHTHREHEKDKPTLARGRESKRRRRDMAVIQTVFNFLEEHILLLVVINQRTYKVRLGT